MPDYNSGIDPLNANLINFLPLPHFQLTHFVMVKELKQLPSIDDLHCNENVKHKTKEFVRKYMGKYGSSFKRDPNDTKEY